MPSPTTAKKPTPVTKPTPTTTATKPPTSSPTAAPATPTAAASSSTERPAVVGDWVHYFLANRTPRPALVVQAYDREAKGAVTLVVFAEMADADELARENTLIRTSPNTWEARLVPNRRYAQRLTHVWDWPARKADVRGVDISTAIPNAVVDKAASMEIPPERAGEKIQLDPPPPGPIDGLEFTPPPPIPGFAGVE